MGQNSLDTTGGSYTSLFTQQGFGGQGLLVPWSEYIEKGSGSTAEATFGEDANQAIMQILVYFNDTIDAIQQILGYPLSRGSGNGINRYLPIQHPYYPQLYAKKITRIKGLKWTGKNRNIYPWGGFGSVPAFSSYQYSIITIMFTTMPYRVMSDYDLGTQPEYYRYVSPLIQPSAEGLHLERGFLVYAEGPGASTTPKTQIPTGVTKILPKNELHFTWHEVPHVGLFDAADISGRPKNIQSCVGKVNSTTFMGYDPGTLLFDPPKLTPHMMGVRPVAMGLVDQWDPPRTWDVEFIFRHFDPPNGGTTKGWNLLPYTNAGPNLKWYLATTDGNPASDALYQQTDFNTAFTMCK